MLHYLQTERENQKSAAINFLVSTHSACPYKNYCLQFFPEPQTLRNYLVCNKGPPQLSRKIVQKVSKIVRYTLRGHTVQF